MSHDIATVAPAFVELAHGIGMCTVATVGTDGRPRTRVMQPVWRWDGSTLTGWVSMATDSPASPTFGVLRLHPTRLRVMPGSLMTEGVGEILVWRRDAADRSVAAAG
ncbi:MAG TPA: hypothetical protein VFZ77_01770 [Acidimicrobiales bacterium]